jgi:hypothetical protein
MSAKYEPHLMNAPGPFYVENHLCLICMLPQTEAPDLMGFVDAEGKHHCYFKKQPSTPEETSRAIAAVKVNCCGALRYSGSDEAILRKLTSLGRAENCDVLGSDVGSAGASAPE